MDTTAGERLRVLLARLAADAGELAGLPLDGVEGAVAGAAHRTIHTVRDQLGLVSAGLLARVEADGRWAASGGARDVPQWAARRDGVSYGAAKREVVLGRALDGALPATRAAVAAREITLEHATVLAEHGPTSPARRAALASDLPDRNEAFLLDRARRLGVDDFRREARRWAAAVDDAAAEREHETAFAREHLTVARRRDGLALTGFLTHEHGELLTTALRAVAGVPAADDERSTDQRMAAALADTARLVLDRGLTGQGALVRPHLSVHVSYETLRALEARTDGGPVPPGGVPRTGLEPETLAPAELESGEPLPRSTLERLLCDGETSRVVFGPEGEVLDVGRARRRYSKQLRRAVVARDRSCRYPGCSAVPNLSEVHHVRWWARGGDTSVSNGILLCWYHHRLVHKQALRIRRVPRGWEFERADGTPLQDVRRGRVGASPPTGPAHEPPEREGAAAATAGVDLAPGSARGRPAEAAAPPGQLDLLAG